MSNISVTDFELPSTQGRTFRLSDYRGRKVVLYFYPKDSTPGCTTEAQQFRDLHQQFREANCEIFGISRDSLKSHANFREKQTLTFDLLSDSDETVCNLFQVIKMKNLYGKQVRGIERSTFLIDEQGGIQQAWRGVKVPGHAQTVLDVVRAAISKSSA